MTTLTSTYGIRNPLPSFLKQHRQHGSGDEERMYRQFLNSEIKSVAGPCLPSAMQTKHLQTLSGMYILQVNSVKNIGVKFEERQKGKLARGPRTLLFELTDGRQTVTAMEFESLATHISDVDQICYGMKVAVCDILIRRGVLLLKPSNFEVLGGAVERTQGSTNGVIDLSATAGDGYDDERRISY